MLDYKSIEQIIRNQNEEEMLINMYNSFLNCKKYKIALEALIIKKEQNFNHQLYDIERINYNELLDKIVALAHELHLSNSLAYCLLFSYLVWHGYCSYN